MSKKTLVLGASVKPARYAHMAVKLLNRKGYPVVPLGLRSGTIDGIPIETQARPFENIHTITLYVGPQRQPEYYDYLLGLNPRRIIFNPGTENEEFMQLAQEAGIEVIAHCTLEMLHGELF